MGGTALLVSRLQAAASGTPYVVTPVDGGFRMEVDVTSGRWWELLARQGTHQAFDATGVCDDASRVVRLTEQVRPIRWSTALDGRRVPRVQSRSVRGGTGTTRHFSFPEGYGTAEPLRREDAGPWRLDRRGARRWLQGQLRAEGWSLVSTTRRPRSGVLFPLVLLAVPVVICAWAAVLADLV